MMDEEDRYCSQHVVNILWRLINAAFEGDSEEDSLSFSDKELLEDVLRFDSLTKIAKQRHVTPATISNRLHKVVDRIEKKIISLGNASQLVAQAKNDKETKNLIICKNELAIKRLKMEVEVLNAQIAEGKSHRLERNVEDLQQQLARRKQEVMNLRNELVRAREENHRLIDRMARENDLPLAPKYVSDRVAAILSSGIDVLRLRDEVIDYLNGEGIETVYELVTIPRHNLSNFIPANWRKHVQDALERLNLSFYMPITYRPEIKKYEKKD